jgi:ABC-2 type transport system ATP-binding protein
MNREAVIEVRELRKQYGKFTAVDGISFQVARGQVFALLGTNGAGKTTTMDILAGYQKPTSGSVLVLGADPAAEHQKIASRMGIMLQEAGLFEGLTAAETIDAWRRFTPGARPRDEALEMVGLREHATIPVGRLSGGEKRRLDLALSLLGGPELLFLDEPTTGLDPEARRGTWQLLKGLVSGGMTVLLTTHYMEEAEFLADDVAIMNHGVIVQEGSLAEITSRAGGHISFRLPATVTPAALPPLDGAEVRDSAGQLSVAADDPQRALLDLLRWADSQGVRLVDLKVNSGSLEDIFLDVAASGKAR